MRILLAEDDEALGAALRTGLTAQGFAVDWVRDGHAALREAQQAVHEALVLDLGLPRLDGMQVLARLRQQGLPTPVLVLTARDAVPDRIAGLDAGADDYLVKPVDLLELAARLRALVRRAHGAPQALLELGALRLDPAARAVWLDGAPCELSTREFDLLHILALHAGRVLTREQIESHLYQWGQEVSSNSVEVHISNLRRKLHSGVIATLRGVGYMMPRQIAPSAP
ncbi:MAG: hypothetical protein RIQ38_1222 [Pseudomonadota bacterium]